jgi:hypothetical protein
MSPLIINITTKSITIIVKIIHTYEKSAKHNTELFTYEKSAKHNTELFAYEKSAKHNAEPPTDKKAKNF